MGREFPREIVSMPAISVLISTYNEPQWLEWVLLGYARQTFADFEMIVVDDGSGPETRARVEAGTATEKKACLAAAHCVATLPVAWQRCASLARIKGSDSSARCRPRG
jgi:glycosyltransferase involved in cell wall biosynthesis